MRKIASSGIGGPPGLRAPSPSAKPTLPCRAISIDTPGARPAAISRSIAAVSRCSAARSRPISSGRAVVSPAKAAGSVSGIGVLRSCSGKVAQTRGVCKGAASGLAGARGTNVGHERHIRSNRPAGPARRPASAANPRRGGGAGASDRTRRRADAPVEIAVARLDDLLGSARHRQDDGRAADRPAGGRRVRSCLGDPFRRRRAEEDFRRRAGAAPGGARDLAVCRRDPPLQPRAAGFLPACHGGRLDHADRRDDRESRRSS